MKPFNYSESKFKEIDTIIKKLPGSVDSFYGDYDPWNDNVTDEQFYSFSHCYDGYEDYWWDWINCPIRKRQEILNEIIGVPSGFTIEENFILK